MAWTSSGWYTQTILYSLLGTSMTGSPSTIAFNASGTYTNDTYMYLSLVNNTPSNYATPVNYNGTSTNLAWVNTDEVTGTGWSSGGVELATAAASSSSVQSFAELALSGPYGIEYTWQNALSVPSTTLSSIYGFIIYFHGISAPVSKPMMLAIYVGTGYSTVSGTLGITPSGSGLSQITLTA